MCVGQAARQPDNVGAGNVPATPHPGLCISLSQQRHTQVCAPSAFLRKAPGVEVSLLGVTQATEVKSPDTAVRQFLPGLSPRLLTRQRT